MSEIDEAADPAALIEAYYNAGWTDGLPVVPPSDASIAATLAAAGLQGHEVLDEIPGRNVEVIAEKAASCGVSLHVRDVPLFDYREALRPPTRLGSAEEEEYEEEG